MMWLDMTELFSFFYIYGVNTIINHLPVFSTVNILNVCSKTQHAVKVCPASINIIALFSLWLYLLDDMDIQPDLSFQDVENNLF